MNYECSPLHQQQDELSEMVRRNNEHTEQLANLPHPRFTAERERVIDLTEAIHSAITLLARHDAIAAERVLKDCLKGEI